MCPFDIEKHFMHEQLAPLAATLKSARERKGLSQRALAAKAGMPQSQISKIENAAVDLQTSSLLALARALDLEVVLVSRQALPAIQTIQRQSEHVPTIRDAERHLGEFSAQIERIAQRSGPNTILDSLRRTTAEIEQLSVTAQGAREIAKTVTKLRLDIASVERRALERGSIGAKELAALSNVLDLVCALRDKLIGGLVADVPLRTRAQRPAYSLDGEDV